MDVGSLTVVVIVTTLTSSIFVLWLGLMLVSRLLHRRSLGLTLIPRTFHAVRYATVKAATKAADNRRDRLQEFLREYGGEVVRREFLELPEHWDVSLTQIRRQFGGEEAEAYWHTSRLHLQLHKVQDLLIERVIDVLDYMLRVGSIDPAEFPTAVRLERLPTRSGAKENFPWRVIVSTNHPEGIKQILNKPDLADWLGIGVDCERVRSGVRIKEHVENSTPRRPQTPAIGATGRCKDGFDGKEGVIGGIVSIESPDLPTEIYGLTCRHVVSSDCPVVFWPEAPIRPPEREFTQNSPDAAFIRREQGCFTEAQGSGLAVASLNQDQIDLAVYNETQVRKAPLRDDKRGVVSAGEVKGIKLGKHFYRGPHVAITPYFYEQFGVVRPFFSRSFSEGGDSGSWVIDEATREWVGMVVGALEPPNTTSYAIAGHYLLDALQRKYPSATLKSKALP